MKKKLLVFSLLLVGGCAGISSLVDDFKADNPDASIVAIDEDGDGLPEALGSDTNGDGLVDEELPGSRAYFAEAELFDQGISDLLLTLGLSIPFAGIAGKFWGAYKPAKRAVNAERLFKGVVDSVQRVRESGKLDVDSIKAVNAALHEAQQQVKGLEKAIAMAKAEEKE